MVALQAALSLLSTYRFAESLAAVDQFRVPVCPSRTAARRRLTLISSWRCAVNLQATDAAGLGLNELIIPKRRCIPARQFLGTP